MEVRKPLRDVDGEEGEWIEYYFRQFAPIDPEELPKTYEDMAVTSGVTVGQAKAILAMRGATYEGVMADKAAELEQNRHLEKVRAHEEEIDQEKFNRKVYAVGIVIVIAVVLFVWIGLYNVYNDAKPAPKSREQLGAEALCKVVECE